MRWPLALRLRKLPSPTWAGVAPEAAGRRAGYAAIAASALSVMSAGRRNRVARAAAAVAVAEGAAVADVPPPPPPPFQPKEQLGAMAPLGFFDPLGFTPVGDKNVFNKMRSAELKHGRVARMA